MSTTPPFSPNPVDLGVVGAFSQTDFNVGAATVDAIYQVSAAISITTSATHTSPFEVVSSPFEVVSVGPPTQIHHAPPPPPPGGIVIPGAGPADLGPSSVASIAASQSRPKLAVKRPSSTTSPISASLSASLDRVVEPSRLSTPVRTPQAHITSVGSGQGSVGSGTNFTFPAVTGSTAVGQPIEVAVRFAAPNNATDENVVYDAVLTITSPEWDGPATVPLKATVGVTITLTITSPPVIVVQGSSVTVPLTLAAVHGAVTPQLIPWDLPSGLSVTLGLTKTASHQVAGRLSVPTMNVGQSRTVYLTASAALDAPPMTGSLLIAEWFEDGGSSTVDLALTISPIPPIVKPAGFEILSVTSSYADPTLSQSTTWTSDLVGGKTWLNDDPPQLAWTQILNPPLPFWVSGPQNSFDLERKVVGCSGTVLPNPPAAQLDANGESSSDFPFHHPFGNDWECYVNLDQIHWPLLSPHNGSQGSDDYVQAAASADLLTQPAAHQGVLGIEMDAQLIPQGYRPGPGDRVAIYGRWIVDDGHNDFHTEIHPPLLLAKAQALPPGPLGSWPSTTTVTLTSRPYLVSQLWKEGSFRAHILQEVENASGGFLTGSEQIECHPNVYPVPFLEAFQMEMFAAPPWGPADPFVGVDLAYNLTCRSGVIVSVARAKVPTNMGVTITVSMDPSKYTPAPLPTKSSLTLSTSAVLGDAGEGSFTSLLTAAGILLDPLALAALNNGVLTDSYQMPANWLTGPPFIGPANPGNSDGPVPSPSSSIGWASLKDGPVVLACQVDDTQPYPLQGVINLTWSPE
jgi:hypothetical protein